MLQRLAGLSIHDLMLLPIERVRTFFDDLHLPAPLDEATDLLLAEIRARVRYLCEVGLGYLTLDRQSRTLSGGEVQRINLTTALGTSLVNTLFVLDEPSIGLHPRDMGQVIDVMHRLRDAGNSLVVVEHDPQIMLAADRMLDIGPGPGERGGEVVFFDTPDELRAAHSLTGEYLSGRKRADAGVRPRLVKPSAPKLVARRRERAQPEEHRRRHSARPPGLHHRRLRLGQVDADPGRAVPGAAQEEGQADRNAGRACAPARRRLARRRGDGRPDADRQDHALQSGELRRRLRRHPQAVRRRAAGAGSAATRRAPSASIPATAAARPAAATASSMSRCSSSPTCTCAARIATARATAPKCSRCTLDGKSIADVLDMTVTEALAFFAAHPEVRRALQPLADVGLEYLRLGQPVPTLSGGEAQRLKLAGHLAESGTPPKGLLKRGKLFLFDEPTTGLHFDDIAKLLRAFRKLLDAGHSLIVIEHNLDVIRAADWIIDLGPEGGDAGGELVCAGTPETVMAAPPRTPARRCATTRALRHRTSRRCCWRPSPRRRLPRRAPHARQLHPHPQRARTQSARTSTSRCRATSSP